MLRQRLYVLSVSLMLLGSLAACDANLSVNLPNSQASPDPQASVSPAPTVSAQPSAQPSTPQSAAPTAVPSSAPQGALTIVGADLFDKYPLTFRQGMRWEYSMKMPSVAIELPQLPGGLPAGFEIPGFGGSGSGGEFGTLTMEVIRIDGNLVTMRTQVNTTLQGAAPPMQPTETTFEQRAIASLYTEAFVSGGEGTMSWRADGSESVSVPAGTYSTDRIIGRLDAQADAATTAQDITLWMAPNVGMVKQETTTMGSSGGGSAAANTILELKSFNG